MQLNLLHNVLLIVMISYALTADTQFYKVLGVKQSATQEEIKTAYKKLSREFHPDKNNGDSSKMQKLNAAYQVLNNKEKRMKYDKYGEKGLNQQDNGGNDFGSMFDLFGGGRGSKEKQGPTLRIKIQVKLEDIYNGNEIEFFFTKQAICSHCRGTGGDDPDDMRNCNYCGGKGHTIERQEFMGMFSQNVQVECKHCKGKGQLYRTTCRTCQGQKIIPGSEQMSLYVEKGIEDRKTITFENSGDDHVEDNTSDIVFQIITVPHPVFKRAGNNLLITIDLTMEEALLGFKQKIKHLDDHYIKINQTTITQNGDTQIIEGEGMPIHQVSSTYGDLVITYRVKFQKNWNEEQLQLWREFFANKNY